MNKKLLLVAGATLVTSGLYSATSIAVTVQGNASANVLAPLIVTENVAMDFSDVAGLVTTATTVILTNTGATSSPDGANALGTPAAGDFGITGTASQAYTITLPGDGVVTLGGVLPVNGFNDSAGGAAILSGAGAGSFTVGATLTIPANTPAAVYSSTYDITVNYQ